MFFLLRSCFHIGSKQGSFSVGVIVDGTNLLRQFVGDHVGESLLISVPDRLRIVPAFEFQHIQRLVHVGVRHWHGAAPDSWFSHLAVEVPGDETSNEWLEAVDSTTYFEAVNKKA